MLQWIITSSVLIVTVLFVRRIFRGKISLRLQYGVWLIVLVRLLFPFMITDSNVSIMNFIGFLQEETNVEDGSDTGDVSGTGTGADALKEQGGGRHADAQNAGISAGAPTDGGMETGTDRGEGRPAGADNSRTRHVWTRILAGVWAAGMIVLGTVIVTVNLNFYRRLRKARRRWYGADMYMSVGNISGGSAGTSIKAGGIKRRAPRVYSVKQLDTPCLYGAIRPAVYLPEAEIEAYGGAAAENGGSCRLAFILCHEESHFRQGDHIWGLLRGICLILHWYNPLVWAAACASRQDGELACDERTLARLGEGQRTRYGEMLIDLTVKKPLAGAFFCTATSLVSNKHSLKERVAMIAKRTRTLAAAGIALAAILLAVTVCLFTGKKEDAARGDSQSRDAQGLSNQGAENVQNMDGSGEAGADSPGVGPDGPTTIWSAGVLGGADGGTENKPGGSDTDGGTEDMPGGSDTDGETEDMPDASDTDDEAVTPIPPSDEMTAVDSVLIDNDYFTMAAPEDFVGNVGYQVRMQDYGSGPRMTVDFYDLETYENECGGRLGGVYWQGIDDYGGLFEKIILETHSLDPYKLWESKAFQDNTLGYERDVIDTNESGTGAYVSCQPTDVQFPMDEEGKARYDHYAQELAEALFGFEAKIYPYEELPGYEDARSIDVLCDFLRAEKIASWFAGQGEPKLNLARTGQITADGAVYYPVSEDGLANMRELEAYLGEYFEAEEAAALLSVTRENGAPLFLEQGGKLYYTRGSVRQGCPDGHDYSSYSFEFSPDGTEAVLTLHCSRAESAGEGEGGRFAYRMRLSEDGVWRQQSGFFLRLH